MLLAYAEPLETIEQRYGVPGRCWWRSGASKPFRRRFGKLSHIQRPGDARLGCRRAKSIAPSSSTGSCSSSAGSCAPPAGRLGRRDGADPVHAVGRPEICRQRSRGRLGDLVSSPADALASTAISSARMAGAQARAGMKASRISTLFSNGTPRRSTPRQSLCSRTSWRRRNNIGRAGQA